MNTIHPFSRFSPLITAGVYEGDVLEGLPFSAQLLRQVHGTDVLEVKAMGEALEGDALLTTRPGVRLLIKTADCLPLVFADEKAGVIAAVHAGWRGLVAGIVLKTIAGLLEKGAQAERLKVGIGPSLGVECAAFSDPFVEIPSEYQWAIRELHGAGAARVDLWAILERQLTEAGVLMKHVEWMRVCTACDPRWFSWRRDQAKGRFGTFIELG